MCHIYCFSYKYLFYIFKLTIPLKIIIKAYLITLNE